MTFPLRPVLGVENLSQQPNGVISRNPLVESGREQNKLFPGYRRVSLPRHQRPSMD
jgi:hypothetical protein